MMLYDIPTTSNDTGIELPYACGSPWCDGKLVHAGWVLNMLGSLFTYCI